MRPAIARLAAMRWLLLCLCAASVLLLSGCSLIGGDDDDDAGGSGDGSLPGEDELALDDIPVAPPPQQQVEPIILAAGAAEGAIDTGSSDYTVVAGDTCGGIAAQFSVTVAALIDANGGLDCETLQVGDGLSIPSAEEEATPEGDGDGTGDDDDTGGGQTYTVVSGDTCSGIADQFGITTDELIAANSGLDCGALQVGDELTIPAGA